MIMDFSEFVCLSDDEYQDPEVEANFVKEQPSGLDLLPREIWIDKILPLLSMNDRMSFSTTSVQTREMLLSRIAEHLWTQRDSTVEICIDGYCPLCSTIKKKAGKESALAFIRKFPLRYLRMHCFITDIPRCLESLGRKGTIADLHLQLTNKSNSPSLESLLLQSPFLMDPENRSRFSNLRCLTLDSSHLQHVKGGGRAVLLDILGKQLISLSFVGLSPTGVFAVIAERCPNLLHLRIDKAIGVQDLEGFRSDLLEHLELVRCNFVLPPLQLLPNLRRVRYSSSFRWQSMQIESSIASLPNYLIHLHFEVPSSFANHLLFAVSRHLVHLRSITIEGAYEMGSISPNALLECGNHCTCLTHFQVFSSKSVAMILFDANSFSNFRHFPNLHTLKVMYHDTVLLFLPNLLRQNSSIKEVVLWHRQRWVDPNHWSELQVMITSLKHLFPNVKVTMEDFSK